MSGAIRGGACRTRCLLGALVLCAHLDESVVRGHVETAISTWNLQLRLLDGICPSPYSSECHIHYSAFREDIMPTKTRHPRAEGLSGCIR